MFLIAVYAPADIYELEEKDAYCGRKCPRLDICIVRGDFNVVSGCDRAGYEMGVGPLGSGADLSRLLLWDFARSQRLSISGSWYRWTWYSNTDTMAKEIDHIRVSTHWRILQKSTGLQEC